METNCIHVNQFISIYWPSADPAHFDYYVQLAARTGILQQAESPHKDIQLFSLDFDNPFKTT
ncbi:hypothetical protein NCCP2331_06860 [Sporosarcina sp. NCCP-2331]|nr:hypothetical protein NCCP2331_06860 [Sporosarcina sp. NCCP-2331]GLB54594.1 hypothetical protein NCCP2378_03790 [Sporosarcina sp. NCCP-2378]